MKTVIDVSMVKKIQTENETIIVTMKSNTLIFLNYHSDEKMISEYTYFIRALRAYAPKGIYV